MLERGSGNSVNVKPHNLVIGEIITEIFNHTASFLAGSRHVPVSTYRLQFNHLFRFKDAADLISYLHELGITDCYSSPYLKARQGSLHGYDISDHNALNPEVGSPNDYQRFIDELKKYGMGHILDFVPNHMGIFDNTWWRDVLENGPTSPYAVFFDIDWTPVKAELNQKVLLPILEDLYGKVLEQGNISVSFDKGNFIVNYRGNQLPTAPRSALIILEPCRKQLGLMLGENDNDYMEFQSILTAYNNLPDRSVKDEGKIDERMREKEVIKRRLRDLYQKNASVKKVIQARLKEVNGEPGNSTTFNILHKFLSEQVYRLSFWRVAGEEINYRRFFDINELVAITMQDRNVFEATHKLILSLLSAGKVSGLRIDHVDGLLLPGEYLWRLQQYYFTEQGINWAAGHYSLRPMEIGLLKEALLKHAERNLTSESPNYSSYRSFYLIVEKILGDREVLKKDWPVDGTTGYDFSTIVNGLFVNSKNAASINNIYGSFTGNDDSFRDIVYRCKNLVMNTSMAAELNVLAHHLNRNSEKSRLYRDLTLNNLRDAIRAIIACFPVYRTYINAFTDSVAEADRSTINIAIAEAKKRNPAISTAVFDFLANTLLLNYPPDIDDSGRNEQRLFTMKFQQFTGPVMAKGMEDTAFYLYNPLISLNEVGGNPQRFGNSVEEFHRYNLQRSRTMRNSMISTSTHDSKRSEDVRARINVISEIPEEWKSALVRWSRMNRNKRPLVENEPVPGNNEEYYLYQTILGTYPVRKLEGEPLNPYAERIKQHMLKAVREAKMHTSWISPNAEYEDALFRFITDILRPAPENMFLADLINFNAGVIKCGAYNSLAQLVLTIFSPGVPDIYRGSELWMYNLTDPDNRRPVNFPRRIQLLKQLKKSFNTPGSKAGFIKELLESIEDSRIKLYVMWRSLNYRRDHPELFKNGTYVPVKVLGEKRLHACAYIWQIQNKRCIVVVPVLTAGLTDKSVKSPLGLEAWGDTHIVLPREQVGQKYRNIFTLETNATTQQEKTVLLSLAKVFTTFPVAVLVPAED